jgi:hypothetical protein
MEPKPCNPGFFAGKQGQSACTACLPDFFAPSTGAAACTPCGVGFTSTASSARCETCVPSAFDPDKFKCYSDLAKVGIIIGLVISVISSIFSLYKSRLLVRERIQKLNDAGVKPTLTRIMFLKRTLAELEGASANHSRHTLVTYELTKLPVDLDENRPESDAPAVQMVRSIQRQLQQQQQQLQAQLHQQQQRHEEQQQQLLEQIKQQQQQIKELMAQLQRLQQ